MEEHNQIIVFKMGTQVYGVSIAEAKEIIKMEEITFIPKAPEYIEGMLNIRGDVYVIFNMRKKLATGNIQLDENAKIILANNRKIGFIVDEISEIIKIEEKDIEAKVGMPFGIGQDFIKGIAKINGNIIIVLNLANILSVQDVQEVKK
ncbi:MAG: chemotaxis protein CheW [Ruminiclostridium sp.]